MANLPQYFCGRFATHRNWYILLQLLSVVANLPQYVCDIKFYRENDGDKPETPSEELYTGWKCDVLLRGKSATT